MVNSNMLLCLYTRVLEDTSIFNGVCEKDVKQAIEHMHKVYQGSPDSLSKNFDSFTDFNEVAYRCAYLFKYAPFHTALAYKAMSHALTESPYELRALLDSLSGPLKLCSLGGGPGTDVIGVLAAMHNQFGFFHSSVKLVDIMSEWELTFWSVLDELRQKNYGTLSESMSEKWFDWSFMTADLQGKMSRELIEVLETADLITMIKFVSAAACKETSNMIEKIFKIMKPGAFILFVDNAAGGFKELISSAAKKYKFSAISTPLKHQPYINECFKNIKYGYKSCYESKIAVQLLMKSGPANYSNESNLLTNWSCNENFSTPPVSHWQKIHVPQFQNFRIGPKPIDNLMNDHETFETLANYSNEGNLRTSWPCNENFPTLPASPWQKTHVPQFQNFRIGPKPVDNLVNDHETFETSANYSNEGNLRTSWPCNENFPTSPASHWQKVHVPQFQNFRVGPKPVDNLINDHEPFESPSNWHRSNLFPSSEFTPKLNQLKVQIDSPMNLNVSLQSQLFCSSTPHTLASKNWPLIKTGHDSGYSDESFESKFSWSSPEYNSSPHSRASHRLSRYGIPRRRASHFSHKTESFLNASNILPQHCTLMPNDENSLAPIPYRQNMQQLEQSLLNLKSPLQESWNGNLYPFEILNHSERYQYEPEKSWIRQSKNGLLPFPPSHSCPRKYKAPRPRKVLIHQRKLYDRKRSQTK
ncbi:unnamed protein product [Larinioides sclopetarius]|uniref:Uncharacterized protein n=1 Tax=Larinioides sclopetarius TaxID=280406 RepID=A0AAV1ZS45_9ARAC